MFHASSCRKFGSLKIMFAYSEFKMRITYHVPPRLQLHLRKGYGIYDCHKYEQYMGVIPLQSHSLSRLFVCISSLFLSHTLSKSTLTTKKREAVRPRNLILLNRKSSRSLNLKNQTHLFGGYNCIFLFFYSSH